MDTGLQNDEKILQGNEKILAVLQQLIASGELPKDDENQAEIIALLGDILEQDIPRQDIPAALKTARERLQEMKEELSRLQGLVNEEPTIAPLLDRAQAALARKDRIELDTVDDALAQIDAVLKQGLDARRRDRVRVLEARANTAMARQRPLKAAEFFAEAAREVPQEDRSLWARMKVQEGNAYDDHGELHPGLTEFYKSIEAYRAALRVYTEQDMPTDWAMTQNNLGNALSRLGERAGGEEGVRLLTEGVEAYRAALRVQTEQDMPTDWAMTQNNLGIVLSSLGERADGEEGVRLLRESVEAYRAALRVQTEQDMPTDWAGTQNNLGNALSRLGERAGGEEGVRLLSESVEAYRAALRVYTEQDTPYFWEVVSNNLTSVLNLMDKPTVMPV
jgi:tetratricopeptide (TPR) repeat protein